MIDGWAQEREWTNDCFSCLLVCNHEEMKMSCARVNLLYYFKSLPIPSPPKWLDESIYMAFGMISNDLQITNWQKSPTQMLVPQLQS